MIFLLISLLWSWFSCRVSLSAWDQEISVSGDDQKSTILLFSDTWNDPGNNKKKRPHSPMKKVFLKEIFHLKKIS